MMIQPDVYRATGINDDERSDTYMKCGCISLEQALSATDYSEPDAEQQLVQLPAVALFRISHQHLPLTWRYLGKLCWL